MKRLMIIFASVLTFASVGTSMTTAQASSEIVQFESVPDSQKESDWRKEFAGIDLKPEQMSRIRELKTTLEREIFGSNFSLKKLLEWSSAGEQGEREFRQSPLANSIRKYNAGIKQVLTPAQYQQWGRNGGGER